MMSVRRRPGPCRNLPGRFVALSDCLHVTLTLTGDFHAEIWVRKHDFEPACLRRSQAEADLPLFHQAAAWGTSTRNCCQYKLAAWQQVIRGDTSLYQRLAR